MKIFVNTRILSQGFAGIPAYIIETYSRLLKIDTNNQYIFLQDTDNKIFKNTVTVPTLKGILGGFIFDLFYPLFIIPKKEKCIYHATSYIMPLWKFKNCKYILTIYDVSFKRYPQIYKKAQLLYYYTFLRYSLNSADLIITISESTKKDLMYFYQIPEGKIRRTYISCSNNFIGNYENKKKSIEGKYILFLSGHKERKNVGALLRCYSKIYNDYPNLKVVIAGRMSNDIYEDVNQKILSLNLKNLVQITGFVSEEELLNLYQNCEFLAYLSFYEGFGIPILEALRSDTLVIASKTSSMVELLPENFPLYVDPHNDKDIEQKMRYCLSLHKNERRAIIMDAKNFSSKFSWDNTAKETLDILKSL